MDNYEIYYKKFMAMKKADIIRGVRPKTFGRTVKALLIV